MKMNIFFLTIILQISLIVTAYPFSQYPAFTFTQSFTANISQRCLRRLDPLYIESVDIYKDELKLNLYNIQVTGLGNSIIKKIRPRELNLVQGWSLMPTYWGNYQIWDHRRYEVPGDPDDPQPIDKTYRLIRIIFTADYTLKSQYSIGGYIFSLPIFGNGDFSGSLSGVEIDMVMPFEVEKDVYGNDIIDLKGYQYSVDVKVFAKYYFTNLYNGNKQSSDRALALINQNWKHLSKAHGRIIFVKVIDRIFNALRIFLYSQPLNLITLPYFS